MGGRVTSEPGSILNNQYLVFEELWPEDRKTAIVWIYSRSNYATLGCIRWHGSWRQYAFFPAPDCIFNTGCLETITARIEDLMERRKTP